MVSIGLNICSIYELTRICRLFSVVQYDETPTMVLMIPSGFLDQSVLWFWFQKHH
uniref:Uncharacterized protein n=1 Tax=Arundo donax TaxID=35708 RepID=A0A0A8YVE3_ARUDO